MLIDRAVRYDVKGKKYIDTPVKYYFTDMGLRNARLNFRQLEETHSMENIIFNELKMRGFNLYYTHNSGYIEKWVTRFLDTLTNQIPVNGQISK